MSYRHLFVAGTFEGETKFFLPISIHTHFD